MLDREIKRGSTEMLILALVEERARHGYEIAKLIEERSASVLQFHVASLYPLLYRLEKRGLLQGRWVRKGGSAPPPLLQAHRRRSPRFCRTAPNVADFFIALDASRASHQPE